MNFRHTYKLVIRNTSIFNLKITACIILIIFEGLLTSISVASILPFSNVILGNFNENVNLPILGNFFERVIRLNPLLIILLISLLLFLKSIITLLRIALSIKISVDAKAKWIENMMGYVTHNHLKEILKSEEGHKFSDIYNLPMISASFLVSGFGYISYIIQAISILIIMFFVQWEILLIGIFVISVFYFFLHKPYTNLASTMGLRTISFKQSIFSYIYDSIRNIRDVKIFNLHNIITKQLGRLLNNEKNLEFRKQFINALPSYSSELIASIILIIIYFIFTGLTQENIQGILPKLILFTFGLQKLLSIGATIASLNFKIVTQLKSFELMDKIILESKDEFKNLPKKDVPVIKGNIKLSELTFFYNHNQKILDNINLIIPLQKLIFFVGQSGSGKSSLMDIICKLREPNKGIISLNNFNIANYNLKKWRKRISYVSQEPTFFAGTILENITLFNNKISLKEVRYYAKFLDCDQFINAKPEKYNTVLTSSASNLSGGQKRRIALIRSLIRKPNILILDESLSSVDEKLEINIIKKLKQIKNLSIFFVTHRTTSINLADEVFLFKNKNIFKKL